MNSLKRPVFDSEMCCHFHIEMYLTTILSNNFEFNVFSFLLIPLFLSWRFYLLFRHGDGDSIWECLRYHSGLWQTEPHSQVYKPVSSHSTAPQLQWLLLWLACFYSLNLSPEIKYIWKSLHILKKLYENWTVGCCYDSLGKGTCCQARWPEFTPWGPHHRRRSTSESCPLTFTLRPCTLTINK